MEDKKNDEPKEDMSLEGLIEMCKKEDVNQFVVIGLKQISDVTASMFIYDNFQEHKSIEYVLQTVLLSLTGKGETIH